MRTTKKPDGTYKEKYKLIDKFLPRGEDKLAILFTLLGMGDHLARYLVETQNFTHLPNNVKYAIAQIASIYRIFGAILRGEMTPKNMNIEHMPAVEDSWKTDEDFEKRFIFVVRSFYEHLQKEGKL